MKSRGIPRDVPAARGASRRARPFGRAVPDVPANGACSRGRRARSGARGGGTIDLANAIQSAIEAQAPEGVEFDLTIRSAALDAKIEGKGECLWDLAAGHVHAASSDVEFSATFDFDASVDVQNEQHTMKANVELPGKIAWKLAVK